MYKRNFSNNVYLSTIPPILMIINLRLSFLLIVLLICTSAFGQQPDISYQTPQSYIVNQTISPLIPQNTGGAVPSNIYGMVNTFAGGRASVTYDSTGPDAGFNHPSGITIDVTGNIYVTDFGSGAIRKITPAAVVKTIANVPSPSGIAIDNQGNLFVTAFDENRIYKITPSGVKSIFAGTGSAGSVDGSGTFASFSGPGGIVIDNAGNLYIADQVNNKIRKITPTGVVSTLAGSGNAGAANGLGLAANFNNPDGLIADKQGNIYVADTKNNLVRKITPAGLVSTFAGSGTAASVDGLATAASFNYPTGLAIDASDNLYVADYKNNLIRKITPAGLVTTLAGTGVPGNNNGKPESASFYGPIEVEFDAVGNLIVNEFINNLIRRINLTGYTIDKTLPAGLTFDPTTGIISGKPTSVSPAQDYTITAYNALGSSSTKVSILVIDPTLTPSIIIRSSINEPFCHGTKVTFTATTTNAGSNPSYQWQINGANTGQHIDTFVIDILNDGDDVSCIVTNSQSSYTAVSNAIHVMVKDNVVPDIDIKASTNNIYYGTPITFTAIISDPAIGVTYNWQVNNKNTGSNSSSFTTNALNNSDEVTCTVSGGNNCFTPTTSEPITMIVITPEDIIIPNTFTPNGDGINDIWNIAGITSYPKSQINIYNRYGLLIYHTKGYDQPWDGIVNGKFLPAGTYYYTIDLRNDNQKLSGSITLIR